MTTPRVALLELGIAETRIGWTQGGKPTATRAGVLCYRKEQYKIERDEGDDTTGQGLQHGASCTSYVPSGYFLDVEALHKLLETFFSFKLHDQVGTGTTNANEKRNAGEQTQTPGEPVPDTIATSSSSAPSVSDIKNIALLVIEPVTTAACSTLRQDLAKELFQKSFAFVSFCKRAQVGLFAHASADGIFVDCEKENAG
ncbi:unnamed protein product, partial [Amoebophrya sp. A25]|eukprot:GSA25T00020657001.1